MSDAVVVGAGPNGLAAAITLAREGHSVVVFEAEDTIGGGARTAELTLPGYLHDVCSAIHPLAVASPFFRSVPLEEHGVELIHPSAPLAHPLDDGSAVLLERSVDETADGLGVDAATYQKLMTPLARDAQRVGDEVLGPLRPPRHPIAMARFGRRAVRSAVGLANALFEGERAKAMFAGVAAHSMLSLRVPMTSAYGLMLIMIGHAVGWPIPRGGSQAIADGLASYLESLGGKIVTGARIESVDDLAPARAVLFDVTPRQLLQIAGRRLPDRYKRRLERYRYGPGAFKVDFAIDGPIPWKARECGRAGTVHLGGTLEEIAASEEALANGRHADRPYVLVGQQSLFDATRAPAGKHTVWAYCHVPNSSTADMTDRIENQIERFAPGFKDCILAKSIITPADLERHNANCIGGDINGGSADLRQVFMRPAPRLDPYSTPAKDIFICSSSTPPLGGVHGMCGYYGARSALRRAF